jgi:hypothetical protein
METSCGGLRFFFVVFPDEIMLACAYNLVRLHVDERSRKRIQKFLIHVTNSLESPQRSFIGYRKQPGTCISLFSALVLIFATFNITYLLTSNQSLVLEMGFPLSR